MATHQQTNYNNNNYNKNPPFLVVCVSAPLIRAEEQTVDGYKHRSLLQYLGRKPTLDICLTQGHAQKESLSSLSSFKEVLTDRTAPLDRKEYLGAHSFCRGPVASGSTSEGFLCERVRLRDSVLAQSFLWQRCLQCFPYHKQ